MKRKTSLILIFVLSLFSLIAQAQEVNTSLLGTWQHTAISQGNGPAQRLDPSFKKIKLITAKHYVLVVFTTADQQARGTFGGDYTFDGKNYQELSAFNSAGSNHAGELFKAELIFKDPNTILISYPNGNNMLTETWEKINGPLAEKEGIANTDDEVLPQFIGGDQAFVQYLGNNLKYPQDAVKNKIQGRVILTFVVETDGSISNVNVEQGIGGGCDEEAIRLLKASPKWIPGKQKGKNVRVAYKLPINFSIPK